MDSPTGPVLARVPVPCTGSYTEYEWSCAAMDEAVAATVQAGGGEQRLFLVFDREGCANVRSVVAL